ncbi:hypothetical protein VP1G_05995 [Cytospora mali]|uniref:Uncharacterized protein n=1 Tax=Cytospora mali TaxID=578113 RepID=A0A194V491_CYTMA|nr:hypothetical protein VP1G_05995 [Valsa mali var. pyri (nom. inval.)]
MAPLPQSRFIEGSMNDRTSNAPPPGYLGSNAEGTLEYQRQFALDWKAPDPNPHRAENRSSFISTNPPTSPGAPTSPNSGSIWSFKGHKSTGSTTSGFLAPLWGGVKEKLNLTRSKSSNIFSGENGAIDEGSHSSIFVLPTFKHKRSESTNTAHMLRANDSSQRLDTDALNDGSEITKLKKAPSAATLPIGGVNGSTSFDPATRPTREEIQASYQSLLASGFFGNRAIQSTRFAAPGQKQDRPSMPASPSYTRRIAEGGQGRQQDEAPPPPPPQRQPPPPPPNRTAPGPPSLSTDTTSASSSSGGIHPNETVLLSPMPKEPQDPMDMLPPPSPPKQQRLRHKPSLSLSSVFSRSTTRLANESPASRPVCSPPLSHSRYSLASGRQSFDSRLTDGPNQQRGVKRPFISANVSDLSLAGRTYYGVLRDEESEAGTTAGAEGGRESGARKLVKKLRKSASRWSMDLGKTISRPASTFGGENDTNSSGLLSPSLQPFSDAIKRSFNWRSGKTEPEAATAESKGSYESNSSSSNNDNNKNSSSNDINNDYNNCSSNGSNCHSNNRNGSSTDIGGTGASVATPETTRTGRLPPPPLSIITGSPSSPERNKLKKKEIRGRRLRRQDNSISSPSKSTYQPTVPTPTKDKDRTMEHTMDWQSGPSPSARGNRSHSRSRSRSRPRRSSTTMFMHNQLRPGTAHSTDSFVSSTSNANYNYHPYVTPAPSFDSPIQPRRSAEVNTATPAAAAAAAAAAATAGTDSMEGVEYVAPSFHFPGRARPGVPLAIVPDANRGIPSVPSIPGEYRDTKICVGGRGENSSGMDAMAIDGGSGVVWPSPSPQALF